MPTPEIMELLSYFDELTRATKAGTIEWKAVNPSTFVWEAGTPSVPTARLTLQRVEQTTQRLQAGQPLTVKKVLFSFQATEISGTSATPRLRVSGADDLIINEKLEKLFVLITSGISQKGLDFLKNLIPR